MFKKSKRVKYRWIYIETEKEDPLLCEFIKSNQKKFQKTYSKGKIIQLKIPKQFVLNFLKHLYSYLLCTLNYVKEVFIKHSFKPKKV